MGVKVLWYLDNVVRMYTQLPRLRIHLQSEYGDRLNRYFQWFVA